MAQSGLAFSSSDISTQTILPTTPKYAVYFRKWPRPQTKRKETAEELPFMKHSAL